MDTAIVGIVGALVASASSSKYSSACRWLRASADYLALGAYALELADDALGAIEDALSRGAER